jgi:serine/threonine protein kinase
MTSSSLQGSVLGKYAILRPLGRGGMAQVYKAYHQQLDRFVAVKILRADLVEEAEFLSRFQREARSVAALRHPHIVQVFDFDVQDDFYFMVMELLEGNSLKAYQNFYRNNSESLPIEFSLRILLDVLSGLTYAHGEGIIHRDLKPANILLNRKGQAVLTDFGIAQIVGGMHYTVSGALMGTLSYMAPEQGLKNQCDFRSDIYSVGIIAYELLTGHVPFEADTPLAILLKHVNDPLSPPRQINPSIPQELETVILKTLAKKPEDRYQNAAEMADALVSAANSAMVDIPDKINLPDQLLENTPVDEQMAVYSGNARLSILDIAFSSGDTDTSISSQLFQRVSRKENNFSFSRFFHIPPNLSEKDIRNYSTSQASLLAILILIVANVCTFWVGGIYGWNIFTYSWPMELAAISLLLSTLMAARATPWFLIPIGILLGNALLLAFSTVTGFWTAWIYTWPAEPFLIASSIILPIALARQGISGRWVSQKLGLILSFLSGLSLAVIIIASLSNLIF